MRDTHKDHQTQTVDWATVETLVADHKKIAQVKIRGTSMYPTLFTDDNVTIAPMGLRKPKNNDLLLTIFDGQYSLHRFIEEKNTTRGDNLLMTDPPPERVIGRVIAVEKTFQSRIKRGIYFLWVLLRKNFTK